MTVEVLPRKPEPEYPESDGQPMAETDTHREAMVDHIKALQTFFEDRTDVYVAGNLFVYYEKGNPRAVVAPDVFVVKGVAKQRRRVFKVWEEGETPCFVLEITSEPTKDEDLDSKQQKYARLGVEEYFLFDPLGEYLQPRLQGFRLERGRYRPMAPSDHGSLDSGTVGVSLALEGEYLRLSDTATGEPLLRVDEEIRAKRQAEAGRKKAEDDREKAEAGWKKAEAGWETEKAARQQAEAAREQAEARARAAQEELARLKGR